MENSQIKDLVIALTILFLIVGAFILSFFLIYKRNQNRKQIEIENLNKEILVTQLEIQEQTLKNISQEIHDNIGQVLSLAKLNLNTMDITEQDELVDKIATSKILVGKAIQDLRDLSRSLNTDNITAMGLISGVEYELELIRKSGVYKTVMDIAGSVVRLDAKKELIIFRIVQEALNNIMKHAKAKTIKVSAAYNTELELKIADDGNGFDATGITGNTTTSLGLRNMEARAKMIGADFRIFSKSGIGTEVLLNIPLNNINNAV